MCAKIFWIFIIRNGRICQKSVPVSILAFLESADYEDCIKKSISVGGDADTLAGLLLELKGEFPALHEKVTYGRYEFEVLEMDNRRILKVKFTVNAPAEPNSSSL